MTEQRRSVWIDAVRGLALLAVLLNHLVEGFGRGPWFTNPGNSWPSFAERLATFYPSETPFPLSLLQFLGWLGDNAPGVFIVLSGLGLACSARGGRPAYPAFLRRRVLRLFPLYVAAHFVILGLALAVPGKDLTFQSHSTLLSLLGLRFTDTLFFYISPSWWFVWTILQLYLAFPVLVALRQKVGAWGFGAITLVLTLLSRGLGLLGWFPTDSLYFWMTGLFAGTRLAEFAAGMLLAEWVAGRDAAAPLGAGRALRWAAPTYALGLASSVFWVGTLVSNLLVSLGLTGLLYALWRGLLERTGPLRGLVLLLGAESYGIYLLHQPPLLWMRPFLEQRPALHLAAALAVLAICLPGALLLRRLVEAVERFWIGPEGAKARRTLSLVATAGAGLALVLEPQLWAPFKLRALALLLAGAAGVLIAVGVRDREGGRLERGVRAAVAAASLLTVFVMPLRIGPWTLLVCLATAAIAALAARLPGFEARWRWGPAVLAVVVVLVALSAVELSLRRWAPRGAGRWGEYPVLEPHPTRVYGLKPSRETHLHYGSYDYVVRTNSHGMASPEIEVDRPEPDTFRVLVIGDAFSMPEGVEAPRAYPALLESRLRSCMAPRTVQVINAGVTGYGPVEQVPQLAELAPQFRPDVVVYEFFVNEFSEALITPDQRLREIGFTHRGRSGPFGWLRYLELRVHAQFVYTSLVERLAGEDPEWRERHSLLAYYEPEPNPVYSEESLAAVGKALAEMHDTAAGVGSPLITFLVPASVAVSKPDQIEFLPPGEDLDPDRWDFDAPLRNLEAAAGSSGPPIVDLGPELRRHPRQPVYFPKEWHWNEEGHQVMASAVARVLTESGLAPGSCAP